MKPHREEAELVLRLELSATFDTEYEGDDDGYAWLERFRSRVQPQLLAAVFRSLRASGEFDALSAPRGKSPEREVDIAVRFLVGRGSKAQGGAGA